MKGAIEWPCPGRRTVRFSQAALLLAILCVSGNMATAQVGRGKGRTPTSSPKNADSVAAIREMTRRALAQRSIGSVLTRVAARFVEIPEYQDGQKFWIKSGGKTGYGPYTSVYGLPTTAAFTSVTQFNAHKEYGALVAIVFVDAPAGQILPEPYNKLKLVGGLNCVYLHHHDADPLDGWKAFVNSAAITKTTVGSQARTDTTCVRPTASNANEYSLPVSASRDQGQNEQQDDYPPVARFDEDKRGRPMIGVRCTNVWCDIGLTDGYGTADPSHKADQQDSDDLDKVRAGRIKGWHDDQVLAVVENGSLVPGVRATVTPVRDVGTKPFSDFWDDVAKQAKWSRVATIWLQKDPPKGSKYDTMWGLKKGISYIDLSAVVSADEKDTTWSAQATHINKDGTSDKAMPLFAKHDSHLDVAVPSTARFYWRDADEGLWVPCDQGCCRVDSFQLYSFDMESHQVRRPRKR